MSKKDPDAQVQEMNDVTINKNDQNAVFAQTNDLIRMDTFTKA